MCGELKQSRFTSHFALNLHSWTLIGNRSHRAVSSKERCRAGCDEQSPAWIGEGADPQRFTWRERDRVSGCVLASCDSEFIISTMRMCPASIILATRFMSTARISVRSDPSNLKLDRGEITIRWGHRRATAENLAHCGDCRDRMHAVHQVPLLTAGVFRFPRFPGAEWFLHPLFGVKFGSPSDPRRRDNFQHFQAGFIQSLLASVASEICASHGQPYETRRLHFPAGSTRSIWYRRTKSSALGCCGARPRMLSALSSSERLLPCGIFRRADGRRFKVIADMTARRCGEPLYAAELHGRGPAR